jgi:type II secretory pathway pseudopilin PulG
MTIIAVLAALIVYGIYWDQAKRKQTASRSEIK